MTSPGWIEKPLPNFAGIITKWNNDKNFGLIRRVVDGRDGRKTSVDRFVHISNVACGVPQVGAFVRFDLIAGRNGKPEQAANVEIYGVEAPPAVDVLAGGGGAQ